jgi:hypothetical protein
MESDGAGLCPIDRGIWSFLAEPSTKLLMIALVEQLPPTTSFFFCFGGNNHELIPDNMFY